MVQGAPSHLPAANAPMRSWKKHFPLTPCLVVCLSEPHLSAVAGVASLPKFHGKLKVDLTRGGLGLPLSPSCVGPG